MTSRFLRFAILFVLLLLTAQVAQPYIFPLMYSATTPKLIVPRGNLSEAEQATIALFDQVSPSVVQVVGRQSGESAVGNDAEGSGVQSGTGFIWDRAGNIVTNNHVVAGASELAVRFASGAVVQADVVGTAPNYDIGVIRLRNPSQLPPPVNIGCQRQAEIA